MKRRWLPEAPDYRAPATRAQWPVWVGGLTVCFLVVFFIGRLANNSVVNVWEQQAARPREVAAIPLAGQFNNSADPCCIQSCGLSAGEQALASPTDTSISGTAQGAPDGCAKP